jgi:hypothetical protein
MNKQNKNNNDNITIEIIGNKQQQEYELIQHFNIDISKLPTIKLSDKEEIRNLTTNVEELEKDVKKWKKLFREYEKKFNDLNISYQKLINEKKSLSNNYKIVVQEKDDLSYHLKILEKDIIVVNSSDYQSILNENIQLKNVLVNKTLNENTNINLIDNNFDVVEFSGQLNQKENKKFKTTSLYTKTLSIMNLLLIKTLTNLLMLIIYHLMIILQMIVVNIIYQLMNQLI